ncbi:glycosyltransferase [Lapillicoccus jejuensis]|nr:glycosyltransferase [Lapillicoccus jejuensis]
MSRVTPAETVPGRRWGRSPLRLAVIGPSRHPLREPFAGGLESLVWHLVRGLRDDGHDVTLFAADGSDGAHPDYGFAGEDWTPSAAASRDVSMPEAGFLTEHHRHLRLLLALGGPMGRSFDLVHNHSLHYLPLAMAPTLPVPMLTTLHTPPTPWLESAVHAAPGRVGAFAAVSGFIAAEWPLPPEVLHVVPNGVDTHTWQPGPGGRQLVWSGRIVPEKAPHLAIEAARRAGLPLVLAGPVHDRDYFAATIAPHLGPDVLHLGHLTRAQLARVVGRSAAALVTPQWDEPYGLVVAEAMACGTPVIAFRRGGIAEALHDPDVGELVAPDDVAAMAAAVPRVVRLDRHTVRRHAVRHLSIERTVMAYVDLYRRILAGATAEDHLTA